MDTVAKRISRQCFQQHWPSRHCRCASHCPFGHCQLGHHGRTMCVMSETATVIVWSLYVWLGAAPRYDIEHRPILEERTKLIGEYGTQARCEEERSKQAHVARCIPHKSERGQ